MHARPRKLEGKERYAYEKEVEIRREEVLKMGVNAFHAAFKAANDRPHYWDKYLGTADIQGIIRKDGSIQPYEGDKNFRSLKNALIEINDSDETTNTIGLRLSKVIIDNVVLELDDSEMDFICSSENIK
jgi:hypothetical protein